MSFISGKSYFSLLSFKSKRLVKCISSARPVLPLEASLSKLLPPKTPRPYQEECIVSCISHLKEGKRRLAISLPTGSGKTVIFTNLIQRFYAENILPKRRSKTLILAHRRELVQQSAIHCANTYPDKTIEIEMGNAEATGMADITIASVQSLVSSDFRRLQKYDKEDYGLLLIDEAHHAAADSYINILKYFDATDENSKTAVIGVTATLKRTDYKPLEVAFDHVAYHQSIGDLYQDKW